MALISPKQVEHQYGITIEELARLRRAGTGPQYYRIAPRVVRYGTDDLDQWFSRSAQRTLIRYSEGRRHTGMPNIQRIITTES